MSKKLIVPIIAFILLTSFIAASMLVPANDNAREHSQASENSPVISETESGEWALPTPPGLEKIEFIHYKDGGVKVVGGAARTPSCYTFLTRAKVKWNTFPVSYIINPSNSQGLSESFVTSTIFTSAETWDVVTSRELMNNVYTIDYTAQYGVQNYKNAIVFGNYPTANVIAVTSVWYNPATKAIVEFDMEFDTDYTWGDASVNPSVMDLQNIATHELGHAVGLGDIYTSTCSAVTMYGYSNYGETSKRTLEQPDITGLRVLYGI